ncbi:NINE protein [Pusillimonas sp. TS35]|uniref:TM2 domain-containing protein n=1 Tax=Paracandidimonas lactea TaxID=2895524 RepID=UPI001368F573|nr:TM2 domain-containing protein [Paracandidimonas lactea]MYN11612.1 NINE protein [Pusillimonas sp. TS35]
MLQRIILAIAIFIVILVALTFGEAIASEAFYWIERLFGVVIHNFADIYYAIERYVSSHTGKVILALLLTLPITWWIIKNKGSEIKRPHSQRKIAIVLAVFLGWLGAHRFYLGQIGAGIIYLVIFYFFVPLAVVLGLIDAVRYFLMSDEEFVPRQL